MMSSSEEPTESGKTRVVVDGLVDIRPLPGPMALTALASSGSLIAVSGHLQVLLFDLGLQKWQGALDYPEGDVLALKFTQDGAKLVAAGGVAGLSGSIVSWDMKTYKRLTGIQLEDDVVLAMDVSPDGKEVAVGGPTRDILLMDLATGTRRHVLRKHADWVTRLAYSHDGVLVASADRFGSVYLWEVQTGVQFENAGNHLGAVTGLQWSEDSNRLWSSSKDGFIHGWDVLRNRLTERWEACDKGVAALMVQSDQLVTIDNLNRLVLYSFSGQEQLLARFDEQPTTCTVVGASTPEIVVGDFRAALHRISILSPGAPESISLAQQPRSIVTSRFLPQPVQRKTQTVQPAESHDLNVNQVTPQTSLELAKRAIKNSRITLEKTRKSLEELELKLSELQQAVDSLEKSSN